jgi:hypothetical protein
MIRPARVLSLFATLLLVSACGGGGGSYKPLPPVVVDTNADYAVNRAQDDARPTTIPNGEIMFVPGSNGGSFSGDFKVQALKKNVTISTLVFRCRGDCSLISDIYFSYFSGDKSVEPVRGEIQADGAVIVNFNPPFIAEVGVAADSVKTLLDVAYNIASFDPSRGSAAFHLDYDGTDSRNQAVETATGLTVNGNKQVISTPGHIICPQTVLSDSWACM